MKRGRQSRATVASRSARFRALAFFARKLRSNRRRAASGHNSRDFPSRRGGCQTAGRQTPVFFLCPSAVAPPGFGPGHDGLFFSSRLRRSFLSSVFSLLFFLPFFFLSRFPLFFRLLMAGQIKPAKDISCLTRKKMEERRVWEEPDFSFSLSPPHTRAFPNPSLPLPLNFSYLFSNKRLCGNRALRMTAIAPDRRRDRSTGAARRKPLRRMKNAALRQDVCPQLFPLEVSRGGEPRLGFELRNPKNKVNSCRNRLRPPSPSAPAPLMGESIRGASAARCAESSPRRRGSPA